MSPSDIVHEYNIVKEMLINNSLPISQGSIDQSQDSVFSRKLIIDKKIIHSLLIDLQRFRKLLNIKKSLFIFNITYDGKPESMSKWHSKVEVRVTQTFRQLNIRRLIDIIGYDPSNYFKGEMSFENVESIKKGDVPKVDVNEPVRASAGGRMSLLGGSLLAPGANKRRSVAPPGAARGSILNFNSGARRLSRLEGQYRNDNLSQNMSQIASGFDTASRQIKDLVDILRTLQGSKELPADVKRQISETRQRALQGPYEEDRASAKRSQAMHRGQQSNKTGAYGGVSPIKEVDEGRTSPSRAANANKNAG